MSQSIYTPKEIIQAKAAADEAGVPWFKSDVSKTASSNANGTTSYYIPILVRNINGKYTPLNVVIKNQILAASAKPPTSDVAKAKDVRITFKAINEDFLKSSEYHEEKYNTLIESNKEFIQALNIISDEYYNYVSGEFKKTNGQKYKINSQTKYYNIKQVSRESGANDEVVDDDGKVALDTPIYRIKLSADEKTRKIGYSKKDDKGKFSHVYTVFDSKKTQRQYTVQKAADPKNTKIVSVVAKLKTSNGMEDLTIDNVKKFITYLSLVNGVIAFEKISISKAGVSLLSKFRSLHVWKHNNVVIDAVNDDDLSDMAGFSIDNGENSDDEVIDEPVVSKSKPKAFGYNVSAEPESNDGSDDEEEVKEEVKEIAKNTSDSDVESDDDKTKNTKVSKVDIVISDSDTDESSDVEEPVVKAPVKKVVKKVAKK